MMQLRVAFWCTIDDTRYLPGDEVTLDDDAHAAQLIRDGLCRPWDNSDAPAVAVDATATDPAPAAIPVPDRAASKAEWSRYALAQGMGEEEARSMSKADLIARYAPASQ
ncbi:hypothetical protein ACQPZ8_01395 [Actinomadura nitritigenes]|uniref:hypothetical protein n=1 Tax=Actinomadura nitritigenes TaxID=134602 RepID=UPI003D8C628C